MTDAIRHRGPDGDGFYYDEFAALGHRRLAIIDRAGGGQPMSNEDGTVWIVFNGEVYNHRDLRPRLVDRGHVFRTQSDTEAIIHAYEEFGESCVDHLEGMFAFAIWNAKTRTLFAARDRLGKKPFFYARLGGALLFGSEIKCLAATPAWSDELDWGQLETYLSLGYLLAPGTIYRHVAKLEPGCWLALRDGHIETRRYWDVERFDDDDRDEDTLLPIVDSALRQAVGERLESEVPLGAFLSGGIDSGLVVAYAAEALGTVTTATVGFSEAEHNELTAAAVTATHFQTRHFARVIEPRLGDVFDPLVAAFDEPFADPSAIPTYYVSQAARTEVTVALSGDGGDEAFGGYDFRYVPHARDARLRNLVPPGGRRWLATIGAQWPRHHRMPRALRAQNVLSNLGRNEAAAYYADLCFMKPEETRRLLGRDPNRPLDESPGFAAVTGWYERCPSSDPVQRAQYADLKVYLPNGPLTKVDRMSMAHSLEIRCPLLDRRVVELAFRIPTATKLPGMRSKHLLRTLADRRLPPGLSTLPKRGFTAPIGDWMRGPHRTWFEEDVLGPNAMTRSMVDARRLAQVAKEHIDGRSNHSHTLWAMWVLERWLRTRAARSTPQPRRAASGAH
jgi:asparagine synthase (glutamine-hydrolysing)